MTNQTPRDHDLFRRYPLAGLKTTSLGLLPVPYHIYDGHALLIAGTADLSAARALCAAESVVPVETVDGKTLMAIWVVDGTAASLDAHTELQFSLVVTRRPGEYVSTNPFALLDLLLNNPDVRLLCHGLWNNTEKVVAYNREVLYLNAQHCVSEIKRDTTQGTKTFTYIDPALGQRIFSGTVRELPRSAPDVMLPMLRLMGLSQFMKAASVKQVGSQVVNPIGLLPHNAEAQAYFAGDSIVLQRFDPKTDSLDFGDTPYRALKFEPQFMEHITGFKFVYLNVHNAGDAPYRA